MKYLFEERHKDIRYKLNIIGYTKIYLFKTDLDV